MEYYQAIPVNYNGINYKSKLEAKYRVFFDVLFEGTNARAVYEPNTFFLEYGMRYTPDFAIYGVKWRGFNSSYYTGKSGEPIYVEVKGRDRYSDIPLKQRVRMEAFAKNHPLLIVGPLPQNDWDVHCNSDCMMFSFSFLDGDSYPCFFTKYKNEIWLAGSDHDEYVPGSADYALAIADQAYFKEID